MSSKKYIVVTGGAGFVGTNLIQLLLPFTPRTILRVLPPPITTACWIFRNFVSILHSSFVARRWTRGRKSATP